jgi:hypothetical protein
MTKVLMAFACQVCGCDGPDIIHAHTASKARYELMSRLEWDELEFSDITVRRAPDHDIVFPDLPPLAAELDGEDKHIIVHAYGGGIGTRPSNWGYRDHYCTARSDQRLNRLAVLGLFDGPHGGDDDSRRWSGAFFYLTDAYNEAYAGRENECRFIAGEIIRRYLTKPAKQEERRIRI